MKNKPIFNVFLREKPCIILTTLRRRDEKKYGSALAKDADCTYSHARKILLVMEEKGLINFKKQGKIHKITLTEKGNKIAEYIEKIRDLLS